MDDFISREDTIEKMEEVDWYHQNKNGEMVHGANSSEHQAWYKAEDVYKVLEDMPSAQPERDKGEWTLSGENEYTCSVCGKTIITNKDYIKEHKWCFGCGADMRGEQDE